MQHCEPTVLALVSLGEQPAEGDARHLGTCRQCRAEIDDLAAVVSAMRVQVPAAPPVEPPARVWAAIAAQTAVSAVPRTVPKQTPEPFTEQFPGQGSEQQLPGRPVSDTSEVMPAWFASAEGDSGAGGGVVVPLSRARGGSSRWRFLAVAAAALVVGGVGGSVLTQQLGTSPTGTDRPSQLVLAQAGLQGLPLAPKAAGNAVVVQTATGQALDVDVSALGALEGEFYEVWLIDSSVKKMIPVGILRGSAGEFVIPAGLNLADYPVVDISIETPGDPRHSGKSVLRGTLPA